MALSPDGRLVVSFSIGDGTIRVWQVSFAFMATMLGNANKSLKISKINLTPASSTCARCSVLCAPREPKPQPFFCLMP